MNSGIPSDAKVYAQSPIFNQDSVPAKLTQAHNTKPCVYGRLRVLSGSLRYVIIGPPETERSLSEGDDAIILPEQMHYVAIEGPVEFQIDFMK